MSPVGPQLFDVLPASILQRSLMSALPADSSFVWQLAGKLPVSDGELVVMDAASFARPRHVKSEGKLLAWPAADAEIWFQVIRNGRGELSRVAAALISLPKADLPAIAKDIIPSEVCSMSIDSATMMVADVSRLKSHWKAGGPNCRANLGGSTDDPQRRARQEQAAALLAREGFRLLRKDENGYLSHQLDQQLTDADVERMESLLAASGLDLRLNVWQTETGALLGDRLVGSLITQIEDHLGRPYLIASATGFGDGTYHWDALHSRGNLVGYLCDFMPSDDGDNNGEDALPRSAAPQPALPQPPIAKPPILPGQIAALLRNGQYLLARVQNLFSGGFAVQFADGSTGTVAASQVLPNPGHAVFQMGDQVLAHWRDGFMFPGTVTAISPQGYTVAWHDGDRPLVVPLGTLTYLYWAREQLSVAAAQGMDGEVLEVAELDDADE